MYIKAKVLAGSKKEYLKQKSIDHFDVAVKEPAERNMANRRVMELIAMHFKIPVGKVRLISGHHSLSKILNADID